MAVHTADKKRGDDTSRKVEDPARRGSGIR
jgi:hypothetical protein